MRNYGTKTPDINFIQKSKGVRELKFEKNNSDLIWIYMEVIFATEW
jgi:hypothetical protein